MLGQVLGALHGKAGLEANHRSWTADWQVACMQGNTAAHHAVREGHSGVLALLIRKGADLSVQNFQTSEYAQGNWLSAGWCTAWWWLAAILHVLASHNTVRLTALVVCSRHQSGLLTP